MPRAIPALVLMLSVAAWAQGDKTLLERFQGTWALTSLEGQGLPAGTHVGLTFKGESYEGLKSGTVDERGTIRLDPAVRPVAIDLIITEGRYAGKTQPGLVEITGDVMTLVLAEPGSTVRPTALSHSPLGLTKLKPLGPELEGSWEGTIESRGKALRMIMKLWKGVNGFGAGSLASADQGTEAPVAAVVHVRSRLQIIVPAMRGTFDGELRAGMLTGTWSQGRVTAPLVLKKSK